MASAFFPLPFAQYILGALQGSFNLNSSTSVSNLTDSTAPAPVLPADFAGWITFLFSFGALGDWAKLFLLGTVFETIRRYGLWFYYRSMNSMFVTAHFTRGDPSYTWIMNWLSKHPAWSKARNVEISTSLYGENGVSITLDGDEDDDVARGSRKITYLPSYSASYYIWHKYHLIKIVRSQQQAASFYDSPHSTLTLSIFDPFRTFVLKSLLQDARLSYVVFEDNMMRIWGSDSSHNWNYVTTRAKRSLNSIILDPGIKDLIVDDAKDFLDSEDWYRARGIPFRRGYLLHGVPGAGKTSLIHGIAGELNLDVYVITLSRVGLDDNGLQTLVNNLPDECVAVMEDIDAAFTHGLTRDKSDGEDGGGSTKSTPCQISLSGLLNSLDGIGSQEGRILIATTNKYSALDPALCRPGRMDLHIEFNNASQYQARVLFERFYLPTEENPKADEEKPTEGGSTSPDSEKDGKAELHPPKGNTKQSDSGYNSRSDSPTPTPDLSTEMEKRVKGHRHKKRGPTLPREQIIALAEKFAEQIPERECSIASLQGYLMVHKSTPILAVEQVGTWIEKEKLRAQSRQGKNTVSGSNPNEKEKEAKEQDSKQP